MPLHAGGRQPQPPWTPASAGGSRVRSRGSRSGQWWDLTERSGPAPPAPHAHPSQAVPPGGGALPCLQGKGLERGAVPGFRAPERVLPRGVSAGFLAPPSGGRSRSRVGPREGTGPLGTQPGSGPREGAQLGMRAGTRRTTRAGAGGTHSLGRTTVGVGGVTPRQVHKAGPGLSGAAGCVQSQERGASYPPPP